MTEWLVPISIIALAIATLLLWYDCRKKRRKDGWTK